MGGQHGKDAYPTRTDFLDHLTKIMCHQARAIAATGVDIIQIDDPAPTYFCDAAISPEHHDERLRIPELKDPDTWVPAAVNSINALVSALPHLAGIEVQLHCCHSVYKRKSDVKGNYKPLRL